MLPDNENLHHWEARDDNGKSGMSTGGPSSPTKTTHVYDEEDGDLHYLSLKVTEILSKRGLIRWLEPPTGYPSDRYLCAAGLGIKIEGTGSVDCLYISFAIQYKIIYCAVALQ